METLKHYLLCATKQSREGSLSGTKLLAEQNRTERDNDSLDACDLKIARTLIETPAITDDELGKLLGLSRQTINRRRNSDSVKRLLREALSISEKEIRRLSSKALSRLEALLDHEDPRIILSACAALLKVGDETVKRQPFDI